MIDDWIVMQTIDDWIVMHIARNQMQKYFIFEISKNQHLKRPRAIHKSHLCQDRFTVDVNDPQSSTSITCA